MKIMLKKIKCNPVVLSIKKEISMRPEIKPTFGMKKNRFTQSCFFYKRKLGMSLIELLVAIVISGIVLSIVMASFASIVRINQKLNTSAQLQKETNFAISRMADKIRAQSVNYEAYEPESTAVCVNETPNSTSKLCVGDTAFVLEENQLWQNDAPLFSKKFKVKNVIFKISPEKNPKQNFEPKNQRQPRVQILLSVESREFPEVSIELQTTISSRKYE